mmetsp:Transcript_32705/g.24145  ORF Transcript_32705/g.24145 Transcript_32705/m.24145 type:complete len:121 (+) Transcript_32705:1-363(+)
MSEENLKKTFINLCTTAFFHNKEKRLKLESLNLDAVNSAEREDVYFRLKKQLEADGELPITNDRFFVSPQKQTALQTQFKIWKRNMVVPLTDQLEEHAQRKLDQIERDRIREENKDNAWF